MSLLAYGSQVGTDGTGVFVTRIALMVLMALNTLMTLVALIAYGS